MRERKISVKVPKGCKRLVKAAAKASGKEYKEFVRDAISVAMVKVGYGPLSNSHMRRNPKEIPIYADLYPGLDDYLKEASESM